MEKKINAYMLRLNDAGMPCKGYIGEIENSLEAKQKYVKGLIQVVSLNSQIDIICNDEPKQLELLGEVVMSYSLENDRSIYETRVQFKAVPNEITEMIVKYIFMEQRITQQKLRR